MKSELRIILMSSSPEHEAVALGFGANAFLRFPAEPSELADAIDQGLHSASTSYAKGISTGQRSVVDSMAFFASSYVLVGACSDNLLRFWDVATGRPLCASRTNEGKAKAEQSSSLQLIKVSKNEATMVGAFDDGVIR